ncbi:acyltransferase [Lacticaseibacillus paracasei]|uniref:acyltransferase family protein n=1 Tax=Lacticaseibacillus paracasei TaxID=1597 RepID=UPI000E0993DD|nr:acyltransferase [Lacticaseibacillus paracasei]RDF91130.1 acyltransferase [Lacticaseibacillus paracasei]
MSKRVWWIDLAKGWTIFFVVVAHTMDGIYNTHLFYQYRGISETVMFLSFTFVMPVFFALSGYLLKSTSTLDALLKNVKRKFFDLIIPYIFFSFIFVALQHLSSKVNKPFSWLDLVFIFKQPIGYMWFLYALFFIFVLVYFFDITKLSIETQCLISMIFFALGEAVTLPYFIAITFKWCICLELGRLLKKYNRLFTSKKLFILFMLLFGISMLYQACQGGLWYATNVLSLGNVISKITSIPIMFSIFYHCRHNRANDYLAKYGKYSLVIYLVHDPATSVFRMLLLRLHFTNYFVLVTLVIILSWIASTLVCQLSKKIRPIKFLFFPRDVLQN